jgi:hypothetical protein
MDHLNTRILPRLVLDAIHCLWLAHDHVDHGLKNETRRTIMSLRKADVSDPARAMALLLEVQPYLTRVERTLQAMERPYTAGKVRRVVDRVHHLAGPRRASGATPTAVVEGAFA